MKVVCILDSWGRTVGGVNNDNKTTISSTLNLSVLQDSRREALSVIEKVSKSLNVSLEHLLFQKLDFGETDILDNFYNADVVVVDMSISVQQSALFYHIGVRQSMGMKHNIVLFYDTDPEQSLSLKLSCGMGVVFLPYLLDNYGTCVVVEASNPAVPSDSCTHPEKGMSLYHQLKKALSDVEKYTVTHQKERFLCDLRKAREQFKGEELAKVLERLRTRLDDPQLLSVDVVVNMLISFRDSQNYNAMVKLIEDLEHIPNNKIHGQTMVMYQYAFALNRRNKNGDRAKALKVINQVLAVPDNQTPDILCLCGRIHKDMFVDSIYKDQTCLQNAIEWYRKGFEKQPHEYAGINLATLLVISGKRFSNCSELQRIGLVLNNLIGKKGSLPSLSDYWDVATFFEISVLAEEYGKAIQAAECMFNLEPPDWYLKSTVGNISLIMKFRKEEPNPGQEKQLFSFWMEFFAAATQTEMASKGILFPVLVLEPTKVFMPSFIQVNIDEDTDTDEVKLWNVCPKDGTQNTYQWSFPCTAIKGVSLYKRDCRAVFLYVQQNSDDFHIFFSSEPQRKRFYELVSNMIANQTDSQVFDLMDETDQIEFEYEYDERKNKVVLGRGTYGVVYAARDIKTQVRIAVKEVPEKHDQEVQPLHEEIKLHCRLAHKNIVKYLGSVSEDGFFKICMEQVPGGSLSQLLHSKWGPLKDNETTIAYYTKQILDGLKYLHDGMIVHRDIKGDNVLVNTYSGVLKISDFGTSKRLSGINPCADTFAGTIQYMAPEVIDKGARGYGPAADIWSLGCTVVEMATGKMPFIELGSPEAAMFKVGFYKSHPEIPDSMSQNAKAFLLRCFDPLPDQRATAEELLKHPFITETLAKKKKKKVHDVEYLRSTSRKRKKRNSMPAGHETRNSSKSPMKLHLPKKKRLSIEILGSVARITKPVDAAPESPKSPKICSPKKDERLDRGRSPMSSTGSTDMELDEDLAMVDEERTYLDGFRKRADSDGKFQRSQFLQKRSPSPLRSPSPRSFYSLEFGGLSASSSMTNLSPDISETEHSSADSMGREFGFYLLRKDSERRITLVHILDLDTDKICKTWLDLLHKDATISNPKITVEHLRPLLCGLRTYIQDQNAGVISETLEKLKILVDFDVTAIMEIKLALYVFHEAVGKCLKCHNIQPHWMFALDNLLRSAVQRAITILSPELGASLSVGSKEDEVDTSGVPSTNSNKSALAYRPSPETAELRTQLDNIEEDNLRLLHELIDVNRSYGNLLRKSIEDKKLHIEHVKVSGNLSHPNVTMPTTQGKRVPEIHEPPDESLVTWLKEQKLDEESIQKVSAEQYTLEDILEIVNYEDLRQLNLRGGMVCRLWKAITKWRSKQKSW
ncbi:mitogen-activated protein kinase kinase kinase 5-like [Pecten maximus]|uniref:mitogen-activated protein kinase kinase kinase 5-like n=1 Tax=Pecten maximus TaxID=6579 RepID=UPI00145826AD|nr:mitogen-activated protein kinase kinase kinase 5-like [Pecten maximus]